MALRILVALWVLPSLAAAGEPEAARACSPTVDLTTLDGSNGFAILGAAPDDRAGEGAAGIGDVNGDGWPDLGIGSPGIDTTGPGSAWVVFGRPGGWPDAIDLATLAPGEGFRLDAYTLGFQLGTEMEPAGDVNGDGIDDFMVSSVSQWTFAQCWSIVVFGRPSFPDVLDLATLDGTDGFAFFSLTYYYLTGVWMSPAGDMNGDGIDDVAFGGRNLTGPGLSCVVFGSRSAFLPRFSNTEIDGTNGTCLWAMGDVSGGDLNGDGYADFVLATGFVHVLYGGPGPFLNYLNPWTEIDGTNGFTIQGAPAVSVAMVGDVNGDGLEDLAIGAPGTGSVYVVYGSTAGFSHPFALGGLNGTNGFVIEAPGTATGGYVERGGDVNGDGLDDILIGAVGQNARGRGYVVFGSPSFPAVLPLSGLDGTNGFWVDGVDSGDGLGQPISSAGDVDGDGLADVLMAAPRADGAVNARPDSGEAYVLFGNRLSLFPPTLPEGREGVAYSVTLMASGPAPHQFGAAGSLPPGLSLDPSLGEIAGVPTAAGSWTFTATAMDADGCPARRDYILVVQPAMASIAGEGLAQSRANRVVVHDAAGGPTTTVFRRVRRGSVGGSSWPGRGTRGGRSGRDPHRSPGPRDRATVPHVPGLSVRDGTPIGARPPSTPMARSASG